MKDGCEDALPPFHVVASSGSFSVRFLPIMQVVWKHALGALQLPAADCTGPRPIREPGSGGLVSQVFLPLLPRGRGCRKPRSPSGHSTTGSPLGNRIRACSLTARSRARTSARSGAENLRGQQKWAGPWPGCDCDGGTCWWGGGFHWTGWVAMNMSLRCNRVRDVRNLFTALTATGSVESATPSPGGRWQDNSRGKVRTRPGVVGLPFRHASGRCSTGSVMTRLIYYMQESWDQSGRCSSKSQGTVLLG